MRYFQAVMLLNAPERNRFGVHSQLDIHLRKRFLDQSRHDLLGVPDFLPPYAFFLHPKSDTQSIIMLRLSERLGLPGEREHEIAFTRDDVIDVSVLLSAHSKTLAEDSGLAVDPRYIRRHIDKRLAMAGFGAIGDPYRLLQGPPRRYEMEKERADMRIKPFSLYGYPLSGKIRVVEPGLAVRGFIEGIGNKRTFGFGLMLLKERR